MRIEDIRALVETGKVKWTTHVVVRLQERGILPSDVKACIANGDIIEEYSDDYPYPSCLVLGMSRESLPLHVVVGMGNDFLFIITAYFPSSDKWAKDLKTRRR